MVNIFDSSFVSGYGKKNEPKVNTYSRPFTKPTGTPNNNNNNKGNSRMNPIVEGAKFVGKEALNAAKIRAAKEAINLADKGTKYAFDATAQFVRDKTSRSSGNSRQRTSSPGSGKGRGSATQTEYRRPEQINIDLQKSFSVVTGFQVINSNSSSVSMSSKKDPQLYENPGRMQEKPIINGPIYVRTVYKLVNWYPFKGNYSGSIMQNIFGSFKQEVNSATNGGNTVTDTKFTETNVINYLADTWEAYMLLMELMSRQAWSSPSVVGNNVLKKVAYSLTQDTNILVARNALAECVSNLCLTRELINYGQWLTQVYKTNNHDYAVDQIFASQYMARFINTQLSSELISGIAEITLRINNNVALYSQITALLMTKTSAPWVSLRNIPDPCNMSTHDIAFNDIFQNAITGVPLYNSSDNVTLPALLTDSKQIAPCCFQSSVDATPVHVTETLCGRWLNNHPLMFQFPIQGNLFGQRYTNFIVYEDPLATFGYASDSMSESREQIGDFTVYPIHLATTSLPAGAPQYDYVLKPKGDQSFLYDPALEACSQAKRLLAAQLFS